MAYDELTESKKAIIIQTEIRKILKDNTNMHTLIADRVYMDDIAETLTEGENVEAGAVLQHQEYPALTVFFVSQGEGRMKCHGFTDTAFHFILRIHTEQPESRKAKQETRKIGQLAALILNNNFTLNGTCRDSDWAIKGENKLRYGIEVSKQNNTEVYERIGDIMGTAYALVPNNY